MTQKAQNSGDMPISWPDFSMYGIHFGVVNLGDRDVVVLIDEPGSWSSFATQIGFSRTRWKGIWVRQSREFSIPKALQQRLFPEATTIRTTPNRLAQITRTQVRDRQNAISEGRLSWHPSRVAGAAGRVTSMFRRVRDAAARAAPSLGVALKQVFYLGLNRQGKSVFELPTGERQLRDDNGNILQSEDDDTVPGPDFLRFRNESDLTECMSGLVLEASQGRSLHSEDFARYLNAILGAGSHEDPNQVSRFHRKLDEAFIRAIPADAEVTDAYAIALKLHDNRPSYWRMAGTYPTPLPIAVMMQHLASSHASSGTVIDLSRNPGEHSFRMPAGAAPVTGPVIPVHELCVGGMFSEPADALVSGVRVTRTDTESLMRALEARLPDGMTVMITAGDRRMGHMDAEARRVLSWIGVRYEIHGMIDIAPQMIAPGSDVPSRLIVIGKRKESLDHNWIIPESVETAFDYETLWNWGSLTHANLTGGMAKELGATSDDANRWQAPYIPSSQVSEPDSMIPKNLLAPTRKALASIIEETSLGIDEFVSSKLGWSIDEMADYLVSEQVDAVALGIRAIDTGTAFMEADQTGLGKGRVMASLARYARMAGKHPFFLTEKADLFRDIYRDIDQVGSLDMFRNPFILNDGVKLERNEGFSVRSQKRDDRLMELAEMAASSDISLTTYSQFNQKVGPGDEMLAGTLARMLKALDDGQPLSSLLSIGNPDQLPLKLLPAGWEQMDDATLLTGMATLPDLATARAEKAAGNPLSADQEHVLRFDLPMDRLSLRKRWLAAMPAAALKNSWMTEVSRDQILLMDESHNASGDASNIGKFMKRVTQGAGSVIFSSATFAKEAENYGIYARLFPSFVNLEEMTKTMNRGGAPLMEIVSTMLAEDGRMIRRESDISNVRFSVVIDSARRQRNVSWSDSVADVLASMTYLSGEMEKLVGAQNAAITANLPAGTTKRKIREMGMQYTNFSSKFYTINRVFQMILLADFCADRCIESLKGGMKPVVTVENTMDSVLGALYDGDTSMPEDEDLSVLADGVRLLGRKASFSDILRIYAEKIMWGKDDNGQPVRLGNGALDKEIDAIFKMIDALPHIPVSPLDVVAQRIQDAGYAVGEVSNRSYQVIPQADGSDAIERRRRVPNAKVVDEFNNGNIDCVILSASGSTGISLHASEQFADQRQRRLIELQPAADIVRRLQFWGRVNRRGQVCPPEVDLISSGMPAEIRLMIMNNAKLRKLSANISGNSDNSAIDENIPDIINPVGNEVCFRWLENNPDVATLLGIRLPEGEMFSGTDIVNKLTSRLTMLPVARQERVYDELVAEFKALIAQYEAEGRNPLASGQMDIRATVAPEKHVVSIPLGGTGSAFGQSVLAREIEYVQRCPGVPRKIVIDDIAKGIDSLQERFGDNWELGLMRAIQAQADILMKDALTDEFPTVRDALASELPNRVKSIHARAYAVDGAIHLHGPGAFFSMYDDNGAEHFIVTGISVPDEHALCAPSRYTVHARSITSRRAVTMPLSLLIYNKSKIEAARSITDSQMKKFLDEMEVSIDRPIQRIMLEGNLYAAAELSNEMSAGRPISYTDHRGVWHHAIALPVHMKLRDVMEMPIRIASAELLAAALTELEQVTASNAFRSDKQHICLRRNNSGQIELELRMDGTGLRQTNHPIVISEDIKACLEGGGYKRTWHRYAYAIVSPGKLLDLCQLVLPIAEALGDPLKLPGTRRAWVNEYSQRVANAADDRDGFDLDAEMKSLGI